VPRRAGDRGAVDAGCLPNLLPGARPVGDAAARAELSAAWGLAAGIIPSTPGRDVDGILTAAAGGRLGALVVAGVDPADLADPQLAERALDTVPFVISLEVRRSAVSRRAHVIFPVAPVVEKAGSFMDWEGRLRTFDRVLSTAAMSDGRVLDALAGQLGVSLGTADVNAVRRELGGLPITRAEPRPAPVTAPGRAAVAGPGEAVLATWHQLLDLGSLTDGDEHLAGTARPAVVRIGKGTAESLGVSEGDPVTVGTERGAVTLPAAVTEMPDGIVWLPTNSPGSTVRRSLGVTAGAVVTLAAGGSGTDGPLLAGGAV
jgi:NADH-quinone oxidoreductase subunit G